jgi:hypothetical protein
MRAKPASARANHADPKSFVGAFGFQGSGRQCRNHTGSSGGLEKVATIKGICHRSSPLKKREEIACRNSREENQIR